jgi:hypothetical protein
MPLTLLQYGSILSVEITPAKVRAMVNTRFDVLPSITKPLKN